MNGQNRQKGITVWGILGIAVVAVFFLLIIVKLVPVYMTDMKVKSALNALAQHPDAGSMTNLQIVEALYKRFQIEDIDDYITLKDTLRFEREGKTRIVRITYEDVTPMIGNVSVLVEFDHSVEVGTIEQ